MIEEIEQSSLWKRTLSARQEPEEFARARELLRASLLQMRDNAKQLVELIPSDCKGITVHDITHLDALWSMADTIAGDQFALTPVEAFVFGAAVLIHDAGMAIAAYPAGMDQIKATPEWRNIAREILLRRTEREPTKEEVWNPPQAFSDEINFAVLRTLHSKHAQELISTRWRTSSGAEVRLLESQALLQAFGESIGRIAYSHHWDATRLIEDLRQDVGALPVPKFPTDWMLNEVKVACLLRCADASHIDARRAPTFLFALRAPQGISREHWLFQNRLNQAVKRQDALIYSSGTSFGLEEARSWWLCFDTIGMINHELQACDAILKDSGLTPFEVSRVYGADNPSLLAKQIRVSGWQPIKAAISVSDPVQLALTLGGRNLYGRGLLPPLREMLQNAIDAIRARRKYEKRPDTWGKVQLSLEPVGQEVWIHVDDNGIGMSERVLTGPLLDFGKSFWASALLDEEFPGIERSSLKTIGKFGIGFFSIFLLGNQVRVISRKFSASLSDTRVLEFSSIGERPIVRVAATNELPTDFVTRVSVCLDPKHLGTSQITIQRVLNSELRRLTAALDVEICFRDQVRGTELIHHSDWMNVDPTKFLGDVLAGHPRNKEIIQAHAPLLLGLVDDNGQSYGRAALTMRGASSAYDNRDNSRTSLVSVGGFVSQAVAGFSYVGVLNGETNDASRQNADIAVPQEILARWASRQAQLIDRAKFSVAQLIEACREILSLGGDPLDLPFAYAGGRIVTKSEFDMLLAKKTFVWLPVSTNSNDDSFRMDAIAEMRSRYYNERVPDNFIVILTRNSYSYDDLLAGEYREEIKSGDAIKVLSEDVARWQWIDFLTDQWDSAVECTIKRVQLLPSDQYQEEWMLEVRKVVTAS